MSSVFARSVIGALLACAVLFAPIAMAQTQMKASIAVAEVRIDPLARDAVEGKFSASTFTREIETALDATGKFQVVSRSTNEAEAFADEWTMTRRGDIGFQRAAYLLTVEVLGVDVQQVTQPIPNLRDKSRTSTQGRIEMRVAVLETASRSTRSRFPIEARVDTDPIVHDTTRPLTEGQRALAFVDLAKAMGERLADRILDEVFPVQVIRRQDALVFLNRGEDSGYAVGERLGVFAVAGERLIDPYTGEDLGAMETQAGVIRVRELRPRFTIAEIVEEVAPIEAGSIVRRRQD